MLTDSIDRPAWTGEPETGNFQAFNHRHIRPREGGDPILFGFYEKRKGFRSFQDLKLLGG